MEKKARFSMSAPHYSPLSRSLEQAWLKVSASLDLQLLTGKRMNHSFVQSSGLSVSHLVSQAGWQADSQPVRLID